MKKLPLLILLLLVVTFSSCVLYQGLNVAPRGSGWATTDLMAFPFFIDVLEDFQPFIPAEEMTIMDSFIDDFVNQLYEANSATNISMMKIGDGGYFIDFNFSSLEQLLEDLNEKQPQTIIKIVEQGERSTLKIYLDLDNYPQLEKIIPFLADPNFETFGPRYNEGMSEDEYLDMISYILGEEGPPSINDSTISLMVTTPKPFIAHEGGIRESSSAIRFEIPLIEFLLLAEPIEFSVTW